MEQTSEELPRKTMIYMLDPEVYDKFIADIDQPCIGSRLEELFQRASPFTRDCD